MSTTRTTNAKLRKITQGDAPWDTPINANEDGLDALAAIGQFAVTPHLFAADETPADRTYDVAAGYLVTVTGARIQVAAVTGQTAPAACTSYVWRKKDGTLGTGLALPTDEVAAPLAAITCDVAKITRIDDLRHPTLLVGGGLPFGSLYLTSTEVDAVDGATYLASATDQYLAVNANTRAVAIVPHYPAGKGNILIVRNISGAYPVTIQGGSNGGSVSVDATTLPNQGDVAWFVADGDESWSLISRSPAESIGTRTITASGSITGITIGSIDLTRCDATAGAIAVSLPYATNYVGKVLTFKKIDASANAVTLSAFSGDDVDGAASLSLTSRYQVARLVARPNGWDVI